MDTGAIGKAKPKAEPPANGQARDDVARILKAIFEDEWRTIPLNQIAKHTRIPESTVRWHYNKTVPSQLAKIAKPAARTVTRAQRTMALAMIAPEPDSKGGRGQTAKILAVYEGAERNAMKEAVRKARLVLKYKPVLAAEVLSGMLQLDPAHAGAGRSQEAGDRSIRSRKLRKRRPDLADRVVNGELSPDEANTLADRDEEKAHAARDIVYRSLKDAGGRRGLVPTSRPPSSQIGNVHRKSCYLIFETIHTEFTGFSDFWRKRSWPPA